MKRLSLVLNSFLPGSERIEFPKNQSISLKQKFNDLIIEKDSNYIGKITTGGEVDFLGSKLKSQISFKGFKLNGYGDKEISIKMPTRKSKAFCQSIDLDVFYGEKRIAYFGSVSISAFRSREYILIFKSTVDVELATFLLIYITDNITDIF